MKCLEIISGMNGLGLRVYGLIMPLRCSKGLLSCSRIVGLRVSCFSLLMLRILWGHVLIDGIRNLHILVGRP